MRAKNNTSDVKLGKTLVRIFRRDVNEQTGKENITKIHEGIVLAMTNCFVRVFNPAPQSQGGDISPEMSQSFPWSGRNCWCEVIGEKKDAFRIPPTLVALA